MELVDVTIAELARRSRSLVVHHTRTSLRRGLAPGEDCVLRDSTGDFYSGRVEDVDFELDDTVYRVSIGVRLPKEIAMQRLGVTTPPRAVDTGPEFVDMDRLLCLLGEVRREQSEGSLPAQASRASLRAVRPPVE